MVFKLLILCRFMAHQCAAGHHEVGTGGIECFVNEEILLFPAEIRDHMLHVGIKITCYACTGFVYG